LVLEHYTAAAAVDAEAALAVLAAAGLHWYMASALVLNQVVLMELVAAAVAVALLARTVVSGVPAAVAT